MAEIELAQITVSDCPKSLQQPSPINNDLDGIDDLLIALLVGLYEARWLRWRDPRVYGDTKWGRCWQRCDVASQCG